MIDNAVSVRVFGEIEGMSMIFTQGSGLGMARNLGGAPIP
jgi:hypothetical protein